MIYITGGLGFIGSNLIKYLNSIGYDNEIYIIDTLNWKDPNYPYYSETKWKNSLGIKFKEIVHPNKFATNIISYVNKGTNYLIHLGAISDTKCTDIELLIDNNVKYSEYIINKFLEYETNKIIYASSASVYGNGERGFKDNEDLDYHLSLRPLNQYALSKYLLDKWVLENKHNERIIGLRLFNVWGPREIHKGNMASFMTKKYQKFLNLEKVSVLQYDKKSCFRDFIYITDVCKIIEYFITNYTPGIYNVGTGCPLSFYDMAYHMFKNVKTHIAPCYQDIINNLIELCEMSNESKIGYQQYTQADISKLEKVGYNKERFMSLDESIQDYYSRGLDD